MEVCSLHQHAEVCWCHYLSHRAEKTAGTAGSVLMPGSAAPECTAQHSRAMSSEAQHSLKGECDSKDIKIK